MIFCSMLRQRKLVTSPRRFLKLQPFWKAAVTKHQEKKSQLCQQSVRYLDLIILKGTRAIGPERTKPRVNHHLPMT